MRISDYSSTRALGFAATNCFGSFKNSICSGFAIYAGVKH
jgi:hypothetical protein